MYNIKYISIYKNQNIHTSKTILPRRRTGTYLCGARLEPSGAMTVMLVPWWQWCPGFRLDKLNILISHHHISRYFYNNKINLYIYVIYINMYIIHRQQKWTADRFPKRKLFGVQSGKKSVQEQDWVLRTKNVAYQKWIEAHF